MYKITLALISVVLLLASCGKDQTSLLDPATTGITDKDVFNNAQYTDQYLTDIYGQLVPVLATTGNNGTRWRGTDGMLETTTDFGSSNLASVAPFRSFNSGSWNETTSTFSTADWLTSWQAIRACNIYLSHIDDVPLSTEYQFDEATRALRKAECTFLLAFNYAELAKQFGGVPMEKTVVAVTDDMKRPRSTFDETIAYIVELCDKAAPALPLKQPDQWLGRATRGAALALKARMLLYAASPLWNNSAKPTDSPFRGKYDPLKWKTAAQAAKAVIDLNTYSLYPDISTLFTTRINDEIIFSHMSQQECYQTGISVPMKLYGTGAYAKSGCNEVTYNMTKEYEIINNAKAYSIEDPDRVKTGYNPNDPYKKLDPRFYRDCMFNGEKFLGQTTAFGVGTQAVHNPTEVSPYYTYVFSVKFADLTIKVNFDPRNPNSSPVKTNQNYPYFRYAEVLLNYAEAMNEAFGPEIDGLGNGLTALAAVNQIRARTKYPAKQEYMGLTGTLPLIDAGQSQTLFRETVRHERKVELSYEEHRFWDCRRWKIDPATMVNIQAQIPTWTAGVVTYPLSTIETRTFETKMYRMPLPQSELYANPTLVQNPGWAYSPEASE